MRCRPGSPIFCELWPLHPEVDRVVLNALVKVTTVLPPDIRAFAIPFTSLRCHGEQTVDASYQLITAESGEAVEPVVAWG